MLTFSLFSDEETGRLIVEEEKERGSVSYKIYLYYFRSMTYAVAALMIGFVVVRTAINVASNFWLSDWSEAGLSGVKLWSKPDAT